MGLQSGGCGRSCLLTCLGSMLCWRDSPIMPSSSSMVCSNYIVNVTSRCSPETYINDSSVHSQAHSPNFHSFIHCKLTRWPSILLQVLTTGYSRNCPCRKATPSPSLISGWRWEQKMMMVTRRRRQQHGGGAWAGTQRRVLCGETREMLRRRNKKMSGLSCSERESVASPQATMVCDVFLFWGVGSWYKAFVHTCIPFCIVTLPCFFMCIGGWCITNFLYRELTFSMCSFRVQYVILKKLIFFKSCNNNNKLYV